ncbi:phospholipase A2 group V isoform X1 [Rousettus aegyptiacus]|uniref:phospholipase A2 group V isoform X1 n=1 Tax=Rousettus aegyptiacus TaxID=9407 RepID=UPI00168D22F9|nr:phospholipase A2 group V isoform X1 [Rousettus aegyptiacus]
MKGLLILAWFLACGVHTVPGSLLNLMWMIEEVTGKNALINYAFYGCYCGWGGHGTPKDATDWCCWEHDRCYGRMEDNGCKYWTIYKHRVTRGLVTCGKAGASHAGHWKNLGLSAGSVQLPLEVRQPVSSGRKSWGQEGQEYRNCIQLLGSGCYILDGVFTRHQMLCILPFTCSLKIPSE